MDSDPFQTVFLPKSEILNLWILLWSLIGVQECVCLVHEQGVLSGLISNLFPYLCEIDLTNCARFEDHATQQHHQSLLLIWPVRLYHAGLIFLSKYAPHVHAHTHTTVCQRCPFQIKQATFVILCVAECVVVFVSEIVYVWASVLVTGNKKWAISC